MVTTNVRKASIVIAGVVALGLLLAVLGQGQSLTPPPNAGQRVLFLQYDYMVKEGPGGHSHEPDPASIQMVVDAFARQGITLVIDPRHDAILERKVVTFVTNAEGGGDFDPACSGDDAVTFYKLKSIYFKNLRNGTDHYVIFGHYNTCPDSEHCGFCPPDPETGITPDYTSLGMAETPTLVDPSVRKNSVVSLGVFADFGVAVPRETGASTIMHELGHNLRLHHGGYFDAQNLKPNYVSVMNYSFSTIGIPVAEAPGSIVPRACTADADCPTGSACSSTPFGLSGSNYCFRVDYSGQKVDLDEENLNENAGLPMGPNSTDISVYYNLVVNTLLAPTNGSPIDWNNNGNATETGVSSDINGSIVRTILFGSDDWSALRAILDHPPPAQLDHPQQPQVVREPGIRRQ